MMSYRKYIIHGLIFCCISFLLFFSTLVKASAKDINWVEVARTNNELLFIDSNSIKYNNNGLLSVLSKYSEVNSDDQQIKNTNSFLMVVDCENRLFSKLPINGAINQVKKWENPINNKLIKTTIIKSCLY